MKRVTAFIPFFFIFTGLLFAREPIRIGSKHFTESYILAEIAAQLLESKGFPVIRVHGLGGTMVCFEALRNRQIDLYPEYTGTIEKEILKDKEIRVKSHKTSAEWLRERTREELGLDLLIPLGFNNTYAIALLEEKAEGLSIKKISDLGRHPELKGGLSYEFLKRVDGWDALKSHYRLPQIVTGLEHGLAYEALREGKIDFTDAYTTDAKIEKLKLRILEDDQAFFPSYQAVFFVQENFPREARQILSVLDGRLNEKRMIHLNAQAEIDGLSFYEVAKQFLIEEALIPQSLRGRPAERFFADLARRTGEHLFLTLLALFAAALLAVPVGIAAYRIPRLANLTIPLVGMAQTIPSIALLAFMIPIFGIGKLPAVVALFIYSLLPIVRNTYAGLHQIEPIYLEAAQAMGMNGMERLRFVEFPLAFPIILAGIKTAAIINIGTATLAAFIGAGGLGEPIVTGLALNDHVMILEGAIPAALLALFTEAGFRLLDKIYRPQALSASQRPKPLSELS
jgi:osmoprotectant transport system permease protein